MVKKILAVVFFSCLLANVLARPTEPDTLKNPIVIGIRQHYGFIIPHSQSIRSISYSKPWGIELDVSRVMVGEKAWDYCHCYPRMGLSFSYTNFDNPAVLGSAVSSLFYVEPFLTYHRRFNLSFRVGAGVSYLNNPYHSQTNPDNLFFSLPVSFLLQTNVALNYRLNSMINLNLAANYSHISNGGLREPNKGINYPTVSLGLDYHIQPVPPENRMRTRRAFENGKKTNISLAFLSTAKTIGVAGEYQRYLVYGLAGSVSRVVSHKSAFAIGAEWVADGSLKEKLRRNNERTDHNRGAVLVGHDLLIGRFTLSTHLGVYVYTPYRAHDPVYQRYGLSFKLTDSIFMGASLKAHRQTADFLDVRLGVIF